jgi:hypothetical protein
MRGRMWLPVVFVVVGADAWASVDRFQMQSRERLAW